MTLYVSKKKKMMAWLLFVGGFTAMCVYWISGILMYESFFLWAGIMCLGRYALSQVYQCPKCGKCLLEKGLPGWFRLKTYSSCPYCKQRITEVKEV
ncbi:MAG: hypothetical protein IKC03_08625 [Oscillospiraceae bacterium]|nr:hypothetical protein [Oscillospiraceae bacterium]